MNNCKMDVKGDTLTITINLKERGGRSKSGKSIMVASTEGIISVPGSEVRIGLNAFVGTSG